MFDGQFPFWARRVDPTGLRDGGAGLGTGADRQWQFYVCSGIGDMVRNFDEFLRFFNGILGKKRNIKKIIFKIL